jgi:outer membrane autotransporter protein
MLDLDAVFTSASGYTETGAGAANLKIDASNQSAFIATPSVELGQVFDLGNGQGLRAYGRVGWTVSSADDYITTARFVGVPASVGGFDTALGLTGSVGVISAGAQLIGDDEMKLDLRYDGAFGDGVASNAISLRFSKRF